MAGIYQNFLEHLKDTGVAKTSNFQFVVGMFPELKESFPDYDRVLALRCETTELPGRQLVTNDSRTYGPIYKTPYQSLYQDVTLNFLETSDFFIRNFFELWMDYIFNPTYNTLNFPNEYRAEATITQYDMFSTDGKINKKTGNFEGSGGLDWIARWHLFSAFPSAVNQMPVAWTEDGLHRVSVTLAYEYYTITKPGKPKEQIASGTKTTSTQGSKTSK